MSELRVLNALEVPWSAGLVLVAAAVVLLVFGSRWRDFTEVLSTSFLGGVGALVLMPPLQVNPVWPSLAVCLLVGAATVLFRRVAVVILAGLVVGLSLSISVNMLLGWPTVHYLVPSLSSDQVRTVILGPDYVSPRLPLALLVGGILLGVILSIAAPDWTRRLVMGLQGGTALVVGVALLMSEFFAPHLPPGYPMKYSQVAAVAWLGLAALGVLMQHVADRRAAPRPTSPPPEKGTQ